jgi:flavin reductase (DIM6/NTAB) family NADH-FMN oxidoreductase RutF
VTDSVFARLAATVDTPMYVVTARAGHDVSGCLVGFATQCGIDPERFLVCLSVANATYEVATRSPLLVVHALHEGDDDLARLFGEETGKDVDKFSECTWEPGPDDVPVLDGCDWFAGRVVDRVGLGDHVGFVVEMIGDGVAARAAEPRLGFQRVRRFDAGNPA